MNSRPQRPSVAALAIGLPGGLLAVVIALALLLRVIEVAPFSSAERMTLPEAAALESDADVVRLLRAGADPNRAERVRRTRIRAVNAAMTPLEAAMTSRHVSVMAYLVAGGARLGTAQMPVLWCLAVSQRNIDAQEWLRAREGFEPPADCADVRYPRISP
ncbi:MAG: hypothetical protein AB7I25_01935 [Vicinamibacterales bacterium]